MPREHPDDSGFEKLDEKAPVVDAARFAVVIGRTLNLSSNTPS